MKLNYNCVRDILLALKELLAESKDSDTEPKSTREIQNAVQIAQGLDRGYDLAEITEHNCTCGICAKYQGRVYAITKEAANGKYKTADEKPILFPYLYETAFSNGRNQIHPNCIHCILVLPTGAYKKKELLEFSKKSMRPFEDERSDEEKLQYDVMEASKNILNEQRKLYENIKKVLPDDAPKSVSGFSRMETAKSVKYQLLMKNYYEKISPTFNHRITFEALADKMKDMQYNSEDIIYSLKELNKEKLIQAELLTEKSLVEYCAVYDVTYEGRRLTNLIEGEAIWRTVMSSVSLLHNDVDLSDIFRLAMDIIKKSKDDSKNRISSDQKNETLSTAIVESKQEPSAIEPSAISPDWNISISFGFSSSQNFDRALFLAKQAPKYDEQEYNGKIVYQATYGKSEDQYLAFIKLYEMISTWKSTSVFINGEMVDRKIVGGLNYCYGDKCRNGNPNFCYGASFMTKNPFGCHRLQVSACNHPWWSFSEESGDYYRINKDEIKQRIESNSKSYKMCPCFDEAKVYKTLEDLPDMVTVSEYNELRGSSNLTYSVNVSLAPTISSPQSSLAEDASPKNNKETDNITQQAKAKASAGGCLLPIISIIGVIVFCICLFL